MMKKIFTRITLLTSIFVASTAIAQIMLVQPLSNIMHTLKNEGYSAVQKIELVQDEYRIEALDKEGEPVSLRINSHSGEIISMNKTDAHMAMSEVIDKIESVGYTGVTLIEAKNNHYNIIAVGPDGKKTKIRVDASTGELTKELI
jgi:uncharacterized membrane protein YkoI